MSALRDPRIAEGLIPFAREARNTGSEEIAWRAVASLIEDRFDGQKPSGLIVEHLKGSNQPFIANPFAEWVSIRSGGYEIEVPLGALSKRACIFILRAASRKTAGRDPSRSFGEGILPPPSPLEQDNLRGRLEEMGFETPRWAFETSPEQSNTGVELPVVDGRKGEQAALEVRSYLNSLSCEDRGLFDSNFTRRYSSVGVAYLAMFMDLGIRARIHHRWEVTDRCWAVLYGEFLRGSSEVCLHYKTERLPADPGANPDGDRCRISIKGVQGGLSVPARMLSKAALLLFLRSAQIETPFRGGRVGESRLHFGTSFSPDILNPLVPRNVFLTPPNGRGF